MKCARCHRRLATAAAWVAGMPLGPKCAKAAGAVLAAGVTIQTRSDRATAEQEAAYRERQAVLFHVEPA